MIEVEEDQMADTHSLLVTRFMPITLLLFGSFPDNFRLPKRNRIIIVRNILI